MGTALDPYAVLAVDPTASQAEITRAYRRLVRRHHPDLQAGSAPPGDAESLARVLAAYDVLRDPASRARYDQARRDQARRDQARRDQARRDQARGDQARRDRARRDRTRAGPDRPAQPATAEREPPVTAYPPGRGAAGPPLVAGPVRHEPAGRVGDPREPDLPGDVAAILRRLGWPVSGW